MSSVVGIDLGTTYSAIAALGPTGRPDVLTNRDGERITPSVVLFDGDQVLVGTMAKRSAPTAPLDVVQHVKRQMGNPHWRFEATNEQRYSPEEVSAIILKRLVEDAELHLGDGAVTDAVITVPAYFDDARRRATRDAGKIAGLNVLRVLNEPTAAALAYGQELGGRGTVLVFDLGGGTFDVTILKIRENDFDVLATDGLHELGGFEWDNRLMDHLNSAFQAAGGDDLTETFESEAELRERAEMAKRTLSQATQARVVLSGGGLSHTITVTRDEFDSMTSDLVNQARDLTISLVEEADLAFDALDAVLLVGGSTRMPMITTMLTHVTGAPPKRAGNPDELVAMGAAIQAGIEATASATSRPPITVSDVTSQAVGVLALNEDRQLRNTIVVPRNTKIPAKGSEFFSTVVDGQTELRVQVVQGDDEDPQYVREITPAGGQLLAVPPYPAGAPIQLTLHYDVDQTISVELTDLNAQDSLGTFEIDNVANLTDDDVTTARAKNENLEVN